MISCHWLCNRKGIERVKFAPFSAKFLHDDAADCNLVSEILKVKDAIHMLCLLIDFLFGVDASVCMCECLLK